MSTVSELLLYLYAESPVHAGGAESIGALDLPVQREATTTYPVIWGQSLKGALRQEAAAHWPKELLTAVFGSAIEEEEEAQQPQAGTRRQLVAGTLAVGDAQLVAMPVPTLRRTFAWVTSEIALGRLRRKYAVLPERVRGPVPAVPDSRDDAGAAASEQWTTGQHSASEVLGPCLVELGDAPDAALAGWADRIATDAMGTPDLFGQLADKLRSDLLLVGSDIMPSLVRECTEFVARVQLGKEKTVENGPFYSEYLPTETILAASLSLRATSADRDGSAQRAQHQRLTELLHERLIQVGGDETIGKGLVWSRLVGGAA